MGKRMRGPREEQGEKEGGRVSKLGGSDNRDLKHKYAQLNQLCFPRKTQNRHSKCDHQRDNGHMKQPVVTVAAQHPLDRGLN